MLASLNFYYVVFSLLCNYAVASNQKNSSFSINNIVNQENAEERDPAGLPFVWDEGNVFARVDDEVEVPTRNENSSTQTIEKEGEEVVEAEEVETGVKNKSLHLKVKERLNEIMQEVQIECESELKLLRRAIYFLYKSGIATSPNIHSRTLSNLRALYTILKPMLLIEYKQEPPSRHDAGEVFFELLKRLLRENWQEIRDISDKVALKCLSSVPSTTENANVYKNLKTQVDKILKSGPRGCESALDAIRRVIYQLSTAFGGTIPNSHPISCPYNILDLFNAAKLMLCDHYKVEMSRKMTLEQHVQLLERFLSENRDELEKVSDYGALEHVKKLVMADIEDMTFNNVNDDPTVHSESSTPSSGNKRKANRSLANEPQRKKRKTTEMTTNFNVNESTGSSNNNVDNLPSRDVPAQNDNSGTSTTSIPWIFKSRIAPNPIVKVDEEATLNSAAEVLFNQIEQLMESMKMPVNKYMANFLRRIVYCLIKKHNVKFGGTSSKKFYRHQDSLVAVLRYMLSSYFEGKDVKIIKIIDNTKFFKYLSEYALANSEFIKNLNEKDVIELLERLV